ncbi:opacity protein-like surface antigen [Bradyrhizobium sp. i1.3.1]
MKTILLGAVALLALAAPAAAADMQPRTYTKAPAYTPPQVIYNWTGFYIGGHVGGAFAGDSSFQSSDARFLGGVQGGFDYQFAPNWVVGIEAQYSWLPTNNNGVTFPLGTQVTSNTDQLGSVTGRIGYTWGPALVYAKGGYAWRNGGLGVNVAPAWRSPSPPLATTRTAILSVPASNTCSHRAGRPRPSTSTTTLAARRSPPVRPTSSASGAGRTSIPSRSV